MPSRLRLLQIWDERHEIVGHSILCASILALVFTAWLDDTFWWALIPALIGVTIAEWGDDA